MRTCEPKKPSSNVYAGFLQGLAFKRQTETRVQWINFCGPRSRRLHAELAERLFLRLLLRSRGGRRWHGVGRCSARTVALRLCAVRLWLITLVVVVLVNIDVTSGWLVMFGTRRLLRGRWCLRHARQ